MRKPLPLVAETGAVTANEHHDFMALQQLAAGLAGALTPSDVARAVAEQSLPLTGAVAGFTAILSADGSELTIVRPPPDTGATFCRIAIDSELPTAEAVRRGEPIFIASPEERAARFPAWRAGRFLDDHGAWSATPLISGERRLGALLFCFAAPTRFSDERRRLIMTVATMAAQAMARALLHEAERSARARAEDAERRLWFLAEASRVLAGSLDYLTTLRSLARLALPFLADWCAVDLVEEGVLRRVALAHVTPEGERAAWELDRRYPATLDDARGVARVLRDGEPVLIPRVDDEMLVQVARDIEHLALLRKMGLRSCVLVPIRAGERTLGVLSWANGPSGRSYEPADVDIAEEIGARAALAIENARHYMLEQQARQEADRASAAAQEADRRKDEFLAMLGHELRNPLTPINTGVQLMRMRGRDDHELDVIERQVRHMARLVDDLMDVSRVTRGKIALDKAPIDLRAVLTRAMEMASPLFEKKSQHVQVIAPPTPVAVEGDAMRLAQVAANLLTNAARYTPAGGHITLALARDGDQAVVTVRDDGIGIAPSLLPHIFDLFVQGPRGIDRAEGGLGIGLTLARSLVQRHGGTIEARSAGTGMGSEFVVRLPLGSDAPLPTPVTTPALLEERAKRVLIVDDNADALELIATILREVGYDVATANDAVEALAEVERFDPHVALLDIGLPVMDGYELAGKLRQRARPPRLVALTGYGHDSDRARSARAGFAAHLTKPVDLAAVMAAIEADDQKR